MDVHASSPDEETTPGGTSPPQPASEEATTKKRNPKSREFIENNLRSLFSTVENEEMPDRFRRLLDELAAEEKRQ